MSAVRRGRKMSLGDDMDQSERAHAIRAELALSRELVNGSGGHTGLPYTPEDIDRWRHEREQREAKSKRKEQSLDTFLIDQPAWDAWADQRADARVASALETHGFSDFQRDIIGAALAEERRLWRGEISKAVDVATKELRSELSTTRAEVSSLRRELEQQRAFSKLHQDMAMRAVELSRLQNQVATLTETVNPIAEYLADAMRLARE